jgi:hypothetical protein
MNDIFNRVILDNTIAQYIFVFVLDRTCLHSKKYVGRAASKIIFLVMNLMGRKIDEKPFIDLGIISGSNIPLLADHDFGDLQSTFPKTLLFPFQDEYAPPLNIFNRGAGHHLLLVLMRIIDYLAMVMERRANLQQIRAITSWLFFSRIF